MADSQTMEERLVKSGFPKERVEVLLALVATAQIPDSEFDKLNGLAKTPETATGIINTLIMLLEKNGARADVFNSALRAVEDTISYGKSLALGSAVAAQSSIGKPLPVALIVLNEHNLEDLLRK